MAGLEPTSHPAILVEREATWLRAERLEGDVEALITAARTGEAKAIRAALRTMLPDFVDEDGAPEAAPLVLMAGP